MKRIFIVMPVNSKSPSQIQNEEEFFLRAASVHTHEQVEKIESYIASLHEDEGLTPLQILSENIRRMDSADYVIFAERFSENRDCRTLYDIAKRYFKTILIEHNNRLKGVS